jgi:glycine cleavage system H protein
VPLRLLLAVEAIPPETARDRFVAARAFELQEMTCGSGASCGIETALALTRIRLQDNDVANNYMSKIPSDLKYAKSHEWARVNDGVASMGITDHAQHELTDVVFVELPDVGRKVKAGDACAVVESVKTASDIYSPLSGEVIEVNKAVVDDPALVNSDPYGAGWFCKIKLADPAELGALMGPEQYAAQIGA